MTNHHSARPTSSRILLIDNFDSFTYNIVHLLRSLGVSLSEIEVVRNTRLKLDRLVEYHAVISSPGPGLPETSGLLLSAVRACLSERVPYLGICLGLQALGVACGGSLRRLEQVRHGIQHACKIVSEDPLLKGVDATFEVGRYHSWVIDEAKFPHSLQVLARTDDGSIQAVSHRDAPAWGVQFHPESIMSAEAGPRIMQNFLTISATWNSSNKAVPAYPQ